MADTEDADSQLLDKIDGKYGEIGDYDDLVNADEDALLEDDSDGLDIKGYGQEDFYNEDENDTDVLDLEAQDAELDDDLDDKNNSSLTNILAVTSTTSNEIDDSFKETSGVEYNRSTDKFKNERVISDNLPEVQDDVSGFKPNRNNRQFGRGRNRGGKFVNQRNNHFQKNRNNNNSNTVHINPHFKGQVKINNDARLAWDARHKINQKHQVGRVTPFNNQNNKNMIRPWSNNVQNNQPFQNIQQVYPPAFHQQQHQQQQPPPQQPVWNQYQPNNFNQIQIPNQQVPINNQPMFMQSAAPPSQNIFTNQPPNQFSQMQNYNTPMYPTQNMNPVFTNTQFIPPQQQPNQFNVQMDPYLPRFQPNQPPPGFNPNNHFVPPQNQQVQFNNPPQQKQFPSSQRFIKPKTLFNQNKQFNKGSPPKRRTEGIVNIIKRKRIVTTGNLHEVKTVEIPDTTVMEERQMEDEDEETRLYREKIEQQKLLRQRLLAEKEKRRQQAIMEESSTESDVSKPIDLVTTVTQNIARQQKNVNQRNLQIVRINQANRNVPTVSFVQNKFLKNTTGKKFNTVQNSNIRVINTANDESNYDKQHLASFLSNRKIIAKDQSLVDTSIVVVSNLAAGTTDVKLRKLCQGIGDVKKLQMSPKERQATIQFNSVASAHEFFKKYQHSMLDLSMIQVALKPTT